MDMIVAVLQRVLVSLPYFAMAVATLFVGKLFFGWTVAYRFGEQFLDKDNPAFGVCFAGYLIGLAIAVSGTLFGLSNTVQDISTVVIASVAAIVLMRLSMVINDKLILYKFSITKEIIDDRNVGTGFVVAGSCVATGLMLNGALTGQSLPLFQDSLPQWLAVGMGALRDLGIYWALGQVILVVGGLAFQAVAGYDIQKAIGTDHNIPVGISFCGFLVALGVITRAALVGAGSDVINEIAITTVLAVCGIALLVLVRVVVGWLLFSKSPLAKELVKDRNPAAGAIEAACSIGLAVLLAAAITH